MPRSRGPELRQRRQSLRTVCADGVIAADLEARELRQRRQSLRTLSAYGVIAADLEAHELRQRRQSLRTICADGVVRPIWRLVSGVSAARAFAPSAPMELEPSIG